MPMSPGRPLPQRIQDAVFAACILLAPLGLAAWFQLCPQSADPACPNIEHPIAAVVAFTRISPLRLQLFLTLTVAAPYVTPLAYFGLGRLAMERAPWLATIGVTLGWFGSIPWGFAADSMFYFAAAARLREGAAFARLHSWDGLFTFAQMQAVAAGWVIGHLLGYAILWLALLRAQAVPRWAAWLIIAAVPMMGPLAYGLQSGLLQVLGYLMVFVGSVPPSPPSRASKAWRQARLLSLTGGRKCSG